MHSLPGQQTNWQVDNVIGSLGYRFLDISRQRKKSPLNPEKQNIPILKLICNQFQPVIQGRPMSKETLNINQEKYANIDSL